MNIYELIDQHTNTFVGDIHAHSQSAAIRIAEQAGYNLQDGRYLVRERAPQNRPRASGQED